jgi:hypothetical protein
MTEFGDVVGKYDMSFLLSPGQQCAARELVMSDRTTRDELQSGEGYAAERLEMHNRMVGGRLKTNGILVA